MSDLIKIDVGIVGLDTEIDKQIAKIENNIPIALEGVGSEMIRDLQEHIQQDWYKPWQPKVYKRRTDNPSLGTPLGSVENISVSVKGKVLDFDYTPTGEYKGTGFEEERNGDELITSLQTGKGLWGNLEPRPFWNYFVEEQKNEKIMQSFINSFPKEYKVIADNPEKDLVFDSGESLLEADNEQLRIK